MKRPVLLLGGTADARRLATQLYEQGVTLLYSVAGLVRTPAIDCEVVSGGFSQFGGLAAFVRRREIGAIVDITHPYATGMTKTAVAVARELNLPYWRFDRPAWQAQAGDRWHHFNDWETLTAALAEKQSLFLTAGQLPQIVINTLAVYAAQSAQRQLLRTAVAPGTALPPGMHWVKAIGPFAEQDEQALMDQYGIDVLVSKNSGGSSTAAKLTVARQRGIPVFMLDRPATVVGINTFDELTACRDAVLQWFTTCART